MAGRARRSCGRRNVVAARRFPEWSLRGLPAATSSESFPCRLPRHGERPPDRCPTHLALTQDVDDILHGGVDRLECAVESGEALQQVLGWRVVWQLRTRRLLRRLRCRILDNVTSRVNLALTTFRVADRSWSWACHRRLRGCKRDWLHDCGDSARSERS